MGYTGDALVYKYLQWFASIISAMKSSGGLMISALSTFLFVSACLFATLAIVAACPSSVLCLTLCWELLEEIDLKKDKEIYAQNPTKS